MIWLWKFLMESIYALRKASIASCMWVEGYTDLEIDEALKGYDN